MIADKKKEKVFADEYKVGKIVASTLIDALEAKTALKVAEAKEAKAKKRERQFLERKFKKETVKETKKDAKPFDYMFERPEPKRFGEKKRAIFSGYKAMPKPKKAEQVLPETFGDLNETTVKPKNDFRKAKVVSDKKKPFIKKEEAKDKEEVTLDMAINGSKPAGGAIFKPVYKAKKVFRCYNCGQVGHIARFCNFDNFSEARTAYTEDDHPYKY